MPTPASNSIVGDDSDPRLSHTTCPPDDDRSSARRSYHSDLTNDEAAIDEEIIRMQPSNPPAEAQTPGSAESPSQPSDAPVKKMEIDDDGPAPENMSPMSADTYKHDEHDLPALSSRGYSPPSSSYDFSHVRLKPTSPSSFLRPGSKFHGTQMSERQVYEVQVEIKHVDMRESFLCGYLRIQGLTDEHPTLTTYFEGEIIGSKYSFLTRHEDWGSTDKVDLQHWAKFEAFTPLKQQAKRPNFHIPNLTQRDNIFMRWKEHFLVPDHRVRTISGASFEGFYYICFNQIEGKVSGIYFHKNSEKFQQLELAHVQDKGCFGAMEFR